MIVFGGEWQTLGTDFHAPELPKEVGRRVGTQTHASERYQVTSLFGGSGAI
jgi:hypothetical protein